MSSKFMFRAAANRDDNEPLFEEVLKHWHVRYAKMPVGTGYDVTVYISPVALVEIKNPNQPPSKRKLTPAELDMQAYCKERGIPYHVLEYPDKLVDMLQEHFQKGGR